ncbi:FimB/Mfa2 family fimbrial subunit [uncultured Duncaniella sp.]|uniref:FimB/Mfa2 family fimbrial subunit n=1 Tax=uncultured Duncaniella sp. TaxID=2768039 RepID=UPI00266F9162|nr:FimB/Mfa2 family fimbrial subunit [uncultured Duncaniella sp.]
MNSKRFSRRFAGLAASVLVALVAGGCKSVIYEPEGDCDPHFIVHFKYDKNLKWADAFPAEVSSVTLYVFDKQGHLVATRSEDVQTENAENFTIDLAGIAPGRYDLLAWCGVKDNPHFVVAPSVASAVLREEHSCYVKRSTGDDGLSHIREDIGRLYHGTLTDVDLTPDEGTYDYTVALTKDTNVIRIVLQNISGAPMEKDDYEFIITDDNGHLGHDNIPLDDTEIMYHPWSIRSGMASFQPGDEPVEHVGGKAVSTMSAVITEFTVSRLMKSHRPLMIVNTKDGKNILTLPLVDCALLVKGEYHRPMTDQDYLDRKDEYDFTFFVDGDSKWIDTHIYINSWRVVLDDVDFD